MKTLMMIAMLAMLGKNGKSPFVPNNSSIPPVTASALVATQNLAMGMNTVTIKRIDWALVCSVPENVRGSYVNSNLAAERSLNSICMDLSYLQTSKFQYGDVYSDVGVPLQTVESVLYSYVTAVVEGDVSETINPSGSFNLDIVQSNIQMTCRNSGYSSNSQDVELPANSSLDEIVDSAVIQHRFSYCD